MLHVGVVGVGTVGGALRSMLQDRGYSVAAYDKFRPAGSTMDDVLSTDIVFLCLPTLYIPALRSYDYEPIRCVTAQLSTAKYKGTVVLKSTVQPGTTSRLVAEFPDLHIVYNPEFLNARTAVEDTAFQRHVVVGYASEYSTTECPVLRLWSETMPRAKVTVMSAHEAELMKLGCNSFYAVKVAFCNELALLCEHHGASYHTVMSAMLDNDRIHPSHTRVPGPDGCRWFGGMCLPKDVNAMRASMTSASIPDGVVAAAVQQAKLFRVECPRYPQYTYMRVTAVRTDGLAFTRLQHRLIGDLNMRMRYVDAASPHDIQVILSGDDCFSIDTFDKLFLLWTANEGAPVALYPVHNGETVVCTDKIQGTAVKYLPVAPITRCKVVFSKMLDRAATQHAIVV